MFNTLSPFFRSTLKFFSISIGSNSSVVLVCDSAASQKFWCRLHIRITGLMISKPQPHMITPILLYKCVLYIYGYLSGFLLISCAGNSCLTLGPYFLSTRYKTDWSQFLIIVTVSLRSNQIKSSLYNFSLVDPYNACTWWTEEVTSLRFLLKRQFIMRNSSESRVTPLFIRP